MRTSVLATFIDDAEISESLAWGKRWSKEPEVVRGIIEKAALCGGLTHREAAVLLFIDDDLLWQEVYRLARQIKERIYGKRIVLFAPLYVSNWCVNNCTYCGYQHANDSLVRRRLTMQEVSEEVRILESLGHKRIALEAGEDDKNCPIDYIVECLDTIYSVKEGNGSIRRVNVNIAATTEENYIKLRAAGIGTYILFQETYHRPTYQAVHLGGPKRDYDWHTTAMDRAMRAGIDDVGIGVLYGLYDYRYETIAMLMHAEHLEEAFGVGPHTISVPRLRAAEGVNLSSFPHLVTDDAFRHIVAVLRLSVPYTGMILSTREDGAYRDEIIALGISQVSTGSCTGVGGYTAEYGALADGPLVSSRDTGQFEVGDRRSPIEMIKSLVYGGYIPSYCTACYRAGRTGDRFMQLAKSGQIQNVCQPNALLTFREYQLDYGDDELRLVGDDLILRELQEIPRESTQKATVAKLARIDAGERDLRF